MNTTTHATTTQTTKGKPVPVRFGIAEDSFLQDAARDTGLPVSELVRRSVRLMRRQHQIVRGYHFVVELAA